MKLNEIFDYTLEQICFLFEGRIEVITDKFGNKLADKVKSDAAVPKELKSDEPQKIVNELAKLDPTKNYKYLQWIVTRYLKGSKIDDLKVLKSALKKFETHKKSLDKKDINQYKSFKEVIDITKDLSDELSVDKMGKRAKKSKGMKDLDVIIDKPNFKVYVPKTKEASCAIGTKTKWCTATTSDDNQFNKYKSDDLYVIVVGSGENQKKFQLYLRDNEFKNADNKDVSKSEIDMLSKISGYNDFLNYLIKKNLKEKNLKNVFKLYKFHNNQEDLYNWHKDDPKNTGFISKEDENGVLYKHLPDGTEEWYKDGKYHREDGPAVILPSGHEYWYLNGKKHRIDGPAIISPNGYKVWYKNGEKHREDGPAEIRANGSEEWYNNGKKIDPPKKEK